MARSTGPPPPGRWQGDEIPASNRSHAGPSTSSAASVDEVGNAWKYVKSVTDGGKGVDLYDLLSHSVRDTQYSLQYPGWPSLLRPRSPIMGNMPAMVLDRHSACQTVCFCGVFPEINRAWASVDNSFFIWRFDRWNDVPLEYSGEEQAICAVGLVRPRPGVFVEAIQYVLVLCTTVEIVLLGVCMSPGANGDAADELTLQPLPLYACSSDNVTMCSVATTPDGRIFTGGANGLLYEIVYNSTDTWRKKRCYKKDLTSSWMPYLPSLPSYFNSLLPRPSPILEIAIDAERNILYTRSQNSSIQVFDLGADGKEFRKVAEVTDFIKQAERAAGGRDIFGGRSSADRKGAAVVHIAPISASESSRLHMLAVTADGRRVYFSATDASGPGPARAQRPTHLRAQVARQAPPQPTNAAVARGTQQPSRSLEVAVAHYSNGVLLLAEAAGQQGRSRLIVAARDLTSPPTATATGAYLGMPGLRETVAELEMLIPGETCAIATLGRPASASGAELAMRDELTMQLSAAPQPFVIISTAGVLEVEKRRPVDVLASILEERSSQKLEQFFIAYGAAEVAAMCFYLATCPPSAPSPTVIQQAKSALENTRLTGEPEVKESDAARSADQNLPPNQGFDMGQAVPLAEPEWSAAYKGLCLYVARVLQPAWEEAVTVPVSRGSSQQKANIPTATLQALEDRLRALDGFLREHQERRRLRAQRQPPSSDLARGGYSDAGHAGPGQGRPAKRQRLAEAAKLEDQRVGAVRALVARAAEGCFLLRALGDHNLGRLAARCDDAGQRALRDGLKLREWVCAPPGEAAAASLISVLITEHLSATGGVAEDLSAVLAGGCPSFFKEDDKTFYAASGLLQRAEATTAASERTHLTREALRLMMKVPLSCDLAQAVTQLAFLRCYDGVVELPLRKAAALDPDNTARLAGDPGRAGREARYENAYVHVMNVLKYLIDPSAGNASTLPSESSLSDAERKEFLQTLLLHAAKADDPYFHAVLYDTLVDMRATAQLLQLDSPLLERHLRSSGGLPDRGAPPQGAAIGPLSPTQVASLNVLARLYIARFQYADAAAVYAALAQRKAGLGDQAVDLAERLDLYQSAVLQAKSQGNSEVIDRLEVRRRLMELQQRLVAELEASSSSVPEERREALKEAVGELREGPRELVDLYNDYVCPWGRWGLALEMVEIANYTDAAYVRQLWDVYLRQGWDEAAARLAEQPEEEAAAGALAAVAERAQRLGERFFPNDVAFPGAHVALRLEQTACGLWPERGPAVADADAVPSAMLTACKGKEAAVQRVYDALLAVRGGEPGGEELHAPRLRLRLLRSLHWLAQRSAERLRDRQPGLSYMAYRSGVAREVGALVEACKTYAAEARRLTPADAAEGVAQQFTELQHSLESAPVWQR
ncbi:g10891 [Coccomyxa elongata]